MTGEIYLDVTAGPHALVARVNGAPLFSDPGHAEGESFDARIPLNEWLQPGANEISVEITPLPGAVGRPVGARIAWPEDYKDPLVRVRWSAAGSQRVQPIRLALPVHAPIPVRTQLWTEAERFDDRTFTDAQRFEAISAAIAFHGALANKDLAAVAELAAYRVAELVRAYPDEQPEEHARAYARLVQSDSFALLPLSERELTTRLVADGRLVLVARGEAPLVQTQPRRFLSTAAFHVYVARVAGRWVVAR